MPSESIAHIEERMLFSDVGGDPSTRRLHDISGVDSQVPVSDYALWNRFGTVESDKTIKRTHQMVPASNQSTQHLRSVQC